MKVWLYNGDTKVWEGFLVFIPRIGEKFTVSNADGTHSSYRIVDVESIAVAARHEDSVIQDIKLMGRVTYK